MLLVKNETTNETFTFDELTDAQDYRDGHEWEIVSIWDRDALIGESAARYAARQESK